MTITPNMMYLACLVLVVVCSWESNGKTRKVKWAWIILGLVAIAFAGILDYKYSIIIWSL